MEEIIAVVGEKVSLIFEADDFFVGEMTVGFNISILTGQPADANRPLRPAHHFEMQLSVTAHGPEGCTPKQTMVDWVVELQKAGLEEQVCIITFEAGGATTENVSMMAKSFNRLRVPGFVVTDDPDLKRIMVHEFYNPSTFAFDPGPAVRRLTDLTIAQRKLLAGYDIESRKGRLVVFATLQPGTDRLMYADTTAGTRESVYANASFTVFACRGKGETVTLVCHTENFTVNMRNGYTKELFTKTIGGKKPQEWMSPNNPRPVKFCCASHVGGFTDGVIYNRLFTAKGKDVMPKNAIHGIINTIGCWMIFRNFNWPLPLNRRRAFFNVFQDSRVGESDAKIAQGLTAQNYDQPNGPNDIGSFDKFWNCDRNYAYNFFFRDVVGVNFFAEESTYYQRFSNLYNTHGAIFANTFPKSAVLTDTYLYHDFEARRKNDAHFAAPDSLWGNNKLGFKTAEGFLAEYDWNLAALPAAKLKDRSWSDWYLFKPETYPLNDAVKVPVLPP